MYTCFMFQDKQKHDNKHINTLNSPNIKCTKAEKI